MKKLKKTEYNFDLINLLTPVGGFKFDRNKIYVGDRYVKIYTIMYYPSNMELGWLGKLVDEIGAIFSINIEPTDNAELLEGLDRRIRDATALAKLAKNESSKQLKEQEIKEASEIISRILQNNEVVSYLSIYILVSDENENNFIRKSKEIEKEVIKQKLKIRPLTNFLLKEGYKSVAPYFTIQENLNNYFRRNILTSTFTGGFLFNKNTFIDKQGYYLGINEKGGIVIFNLWQKDSDRTNSNMVVVGSSGSGKSVAVKHIAYNEIPNSKILIIDPENEYSYLCENLGGKIINCNGGERGGILNPLQIRIDREENTNSLALHFQFLRTFFSILYPSLQDMEFSALELLLEELYEKFNITKNTDISKLKNTDFPKLEDLYFFIEEKNKQSGNEIFEKILSLIRPICIGQSADIWNGYTNIDIDTDMTVFNTSSMHKFQEQYKRAQYYNIMSYCWDFLSRDVNERTILIADECHMLIDPNIPQTLEYLKNISKRARKYNASIIVITQSIEDFLNEKIRLYGQSLFTNSTYKLFFKLDGQDLKDVQETFKLTDKETQLIYNAKIGEALFTAGIRKIFINMQIDKIEKELIDEKFMRVKSYA